jgi:hypothetical protein
MMEPVDLAKLRQKLRRSRLACDAIGKVGSGPKFKHVLGIRLAIPAARIESLRSAKLPSLRCSSSMSLCPNIRAVSGYC